MKEDNVINIELTNEKMKYQPEALLKMFVELGKKAQEELDKRNEIN